MKFLSNLSLGQKVTLLTIAATVANVGVFSFLGIRAANQATEVMLQDRLTTARLVAEYLDEALGRALTEVENTAQMIATGEATSNFDTQIETLEATYSRFSIYIYDIYLLNKEERIIWSKSEVIGVEGVDMSLYPGISEAVSGDDASISGLVLAPVTDTPVVFLVSPIKEGQQGTEGALVVAIDPVKSSISGFVQPIRLGQTGYVEIVDQNGIVVARTEPGPELAPFEKSDHSGHFAALIAAGKPTQGLCHTCHAAAKKVETRDVLAFVPLSKAHWGVVIRQSEEEALAPVNDLRKNLLLFGGGLVMVLLLFVLVVTRDVISRIKRLTTASQRIAEGDLSTPVSALGKDEVGILASTLDNMRGKLKTSYSDLEQLHQEMQRKDEIRGELLQDTLSIQEEERRRIARGLHDETTQVLASLAASLEVVAGMLPDGTDEAKLTLKKAQALSVNVLDGMHKLIYELRPTMLDDLGLVSAIRWLLDNNLAAIGITVKLKLVGTERRLSPQLEVTLFRVIQEAVSNIARHAHARSTNISLRFKKRSIKVRVKDNGVGFDVTEAVSSKDRPRGLGLIGMKERVELMHGTLNIQSSPGSGGTEIDIEIPYK